MGAGESQPQGVDHILPEAGEGGRHRRSEVKLHSSCTSNVSLLPHLCGSDFNSRYLVLANDATRVLRALELCGGSPYTFPGFVTLGPPPIILRGMLLQPGSHPCLQCRVRLSVNYLRV